MEPSLVLGAAIFVVVLVLVIKFRTARIIVAAGLLLAAALTLHGVARADAKRGLIVAVFYEEDTFIVEYDDGNRDLYDDRGDLVPGDEIFVDGDDVKLGAQSDWVWFDYCLDGEPVASFLYPEDAQFVKELVAN